MAICHITLCDVRNNSLTGTTMPVPQSVAIDAETITTSGTSQQSTIAASQLNIYAGASTLIWTVVSTSNIWVDFGVDPTADAGSGWFVPAGVPMSFSVTVSAEKIAVKDAT
jgi:hypothetical protein